MSWLFSGEIEHRDSNGVHAMVRPGELNLMTGGYGIAHSEVSTAKTTVLHGVQLWIALPGESRGSPRDFAHHIPPVVPVEGGTVRVLLGTLAGRTSPVPTFTALVGAEVTVAAGDRMKLDVDPAFEHAVLVDRGSVEVHGTVLQRGELGCLDPGPADLELVNRADSAARLVLLGGEPFSEDIVMWWNFVGRSHEEIVAFREAWEDEADRFGRVEGYLGPIGRLPAPELPHVRLRPRRRR